MNIRVIGDEVVRDGEVIARLVGRAAGPATTLQGDLIELMEEPLAALSTEELLDRIDSADLLDEIAERKLEADVIADMDDGILLNEVRQRQAEHKIVAGLTQEDLEQALEYRREQMRRRVA